MKNDYDADFEVETERYRPQGSGGLRWMSMLVMALVVFGFFSLVWYAYNASVTPEQGEMVATIAPENEAYKVKPEDAGGMEIANKDIEAYQLMRRQPDAMEEAAKVERLLPSPAEPIAVTPQTQTTATASEMAAIASAEASLNTKPTQETLPVPNNPVAPAPVASVSVGEAPVATVAQPLIEPAPAVLAPTPAPLVTPPAPAFVVQAPPPAPKPAPAPIAAPQPTFESVVKQPIVAAPKPAPAKPASIKPAPAKPAPSAASGVYVQLGAVRSRAEAEKLWSAVRAKHGDVLSSAYSIEEVAVAGTGTLYRVRARGFASRASALSACSSLKARGQDCLVSQ
jgi:SPOR domain